MKKGEIFLSVVIPCYNEAENINRGVLEGVYNYFKDKDYSWEVLVSDDGSSDESVSLIEDRIRSLPNFYLIKNSHGGKPSALLGGVKVARGKYVLFTDMDQSTPISELDKLIPHTKDNVEAVIGSRGVIRKDFPLYRKIGAVVFMMVRRVLILPELVDTQCGFKLFRSDILKKVFPKLEFFKKEENRVGWVVSSYDVELLHLVKKTGGRIVEIPVLWKDEDKSKTKGSSFKRYFKESKEMFFQILRVKLNDWRGMYKDL